MCLSVKIFGDLVNLPDGAGFTVDVRRRRKQDGAIIFSLYGGDYDEVTFEVNYLDDNSLRFQVPFVLKQHIKVLSQLLSRHVSSVLPDKSC